MKIHIPNSAFLGNIDTFIKTFDPSDTNQLTISVNKQWFSIHPMVLSMIAALGIGIDKKHIKCEQLEAKSKHYLHRMGLFKLLGIQTKLKVIEHDPSGRFIPLTQITTSEALSHFIQDMIPLLHLPHHQVEPIKYVISELVRNVLEHAQSEGAIVCAQYYKKSNMIRIGIADRGSGLKKSLSQSHTVESNLHAIQLSLTPGITGTTKQEGGTDYNAGAGLFFIKSIAKMNRDFFVIYSGDTFYKLLKRSEKSIIRLFSNPFEDKHSKQDKLPFWQGTIIGIDISLENNTSSFAELLSLIRETYSKSIRERKRQKYKKPRFI